MQIQLINLAQSSDRLDRFLRANGHLRDVQRFPAVDGREVDREKIITEGIASSGLDYLPGAIGCALSHIALWRRAVSEQRAITIAEDDALFSYQFPERSQALLAEAGGDWDVITWGFLYQTFLWVELPQSISVAEIRCRNSLLQGRIEEFQAAIYPSVLLRLRQQYGTPAYSVSPKGAASLLEGCLPLSPKLISFRDFPIVDKNLGIDCAMNGVYPRLNAYVCFPPLVVADARLASTVR